jgi:TPR repeat protein
VWKISQCNFTYHYTYRKEDESKVFEYYKQSANQDYLEFGYCYGLGIGTDSNQTKAFEYY